MRKLFVNITAIFVVLIFSTSLNALETKVHIDVLYFHASLRCNGCITIEEFTQNSINSIFEKQLKDSTILIKSIDFQQLENEHFQDDYKFDTQTLIISKKINGKEVKWKNLDKIWDYSSSYKKFQKYIKEEINKFLKES